ncbi:MAG: pilus assembly protein PilV [Nitrosomonadales bacterium]|jgi:type IV pilus assembly protein PilV|nr:MAG: pilus assembly protein PilV [Nitrosomonadales bacterium]
MNIQLRKKQKGSMLLEALIAILIFSMGILALMGMQATAINTVSESKYRSDAGFLANRIIGQIWADRANLASFACNPCTTTGTGNVDTRAWATEIQSGALQLPGVTDAANQPIITLGASNQVQVQLFWQAPNATAQRNHLVIAYING